MSPVPAIGRGGKRICLAVGGSRFGCARSCQAVELTACQEGGKPWCSYARAETLRSPTVRRRFRRQKLACGRATLELLALLKPCAYSRTRLLECRTDTSIDVGYCAVPRTPSFDCCASVAKVAPAIVWTIPSTGRPKRFRLSWQQYQRMVYVVAAEVLDAMASGEQRTLQDLRIYLVELGVPYASTHRILRVMQGELGPQQEGQPFMMSASCPVAADLKRDWSA